MVLWYYLHRIAMTNNHFTHKLKLVEFMGTYGTVRMSTVLQVFILLVVPSLTWYCFTDAHATARDSLVRQKRCKDNNIHSKNFFCIQKIMLRHIITTTKFVIL